jgi:hypothetical protein
MDRRFLYAGLLVWLAATSSAAEPPAPTRATTAVAPPTRVPESLTPAATVTGEAVATSSMPAATRRAVADDAARRFNVASSAVVLTRAERVTWPDGSLGCPVPGRSYQQILVSGFRVVARTQQGELLYHTDTRGNVVSCGFSGEAPHDALKRRAPPEPVTSPPAPQDR